MEAAGEALALLFTAKSLTLLVLGTVIGTIVAIVPGLGSPVALAVLLPATFTMRPDEALTFLVPIIGAGGFAGSMTAILVGVPGDETNAATVMDGHSLAKQGRAGEAIGAAATSSALGALFGVLVLVVSIPFLRGLILRVGPPEVFMIALLGILMVGAVSGRQDRFKGVLSGLLGMALGLIGFNYALGGIRFTFGVSELAEGVPIVPALVGLFAIPEAVLMMRDMRPISPEGLVRGGVAKGILAVLRRPRLLLQSSLLGTGIGLVPGVGGSVACWISYFAAQRSSKEPETFGQGSIEGVIGPEATIDAKDGGQLMPLLALGIPGGVTTAILAGAFLFHGIRPGQAMFTSGLPLVYLMVFALIFSNVSTSLLGLVSANQMIKLTVVPPYVVAPLVVALGAVGSYVATTSFYGAAVFLVFGVLGYLFLRGGYSRPAIVVGMILLPIIETNLHVALQSHRGQLTFLLRPGTLALLLLGATAFLAPLALRAWRARRVRRAGASPIVEAVSVVVEADAAAGHADHSRVADVVVGATSAVWGLLLLQQALGLPGDQRLIPLLVLPFLVALGALALWRALRERGEATAAQAVNRRDVLVGVGVLALPLLMWLLGMFTGIFVWSAAVMFGFGLSRQRPVGLAGLLALAALFTVGLYLLVGRVLEVRLPEGLLV